MEDGLLMEVLMKVLISRAWLAFSKILRDVESFWNLWLWQIMDILLIVFKARTIWGHLRGWKDILNAIHQIRIRIDKLSFWVSELGKVIEFNQVKPNALPIPLCTRTGLPWSSSTVIAKLCAKNTAVAISKHQITGSCALTECPVSQRAYKHAYKLISQ